MSDERPKTGGSFVRMPDGSLVKRPLNAPADWMPGDMIPEPMPEPESTVDPDLADPADVQDDDEEMED
jgi:hypothetical protein